jgi:release factor glutamine methyltransferase
MALPISKTLSSSASKALSSSAKADDPASASDSAADDASTKPFAFTGFPAFAGNDSVGGLSAVSARRALIEAFRAGNLDTPELDARVLIGHALGLDHAALTAAGDQILRAADMTSIAAFATRRLAREPVARIIGVKEFWSLPLRVTAATLVPRPETETVVEAALATIDANGPRTRALRIADLGTGSGALLLALLSELPNARGIGTDTNVGAIAVARQNAEHLGCGRAEFVVCDLATALRGPFDLIVSNPPYIAAREIAALAPEVRDHDPRQALDGGPDGLDFYGAIAAAAGNLLAPDGDIVVELGAGQAPAVTALFAATGLAVTGIRNDLLGIARALSARIPA